MSIPPQEKSDAIRFNGNQTETAIGSILLITAQEELFNHIDQKMPIWSENGERKVVTTVIFRTSFLAPPVIMLSPTGIDITHDKYFRFWLCAKDITATGFKIEHSTWEDIHIARAVVSWTALGKAVVSGEGSL